MSTDTKNRQPFTVQDCALVAIAEGQKAHNLKDLRDILTTVHSGCIYYHFWGGLLRHRFNERPYYNDFAIWAHQSIHDKVLAERLGVIDPTDYTDMEALRQELVEVIEEHLDLSEYIPWARYDEQFQFIRSQIVVFDTYKRVDQPKDLADILPSLSGSSIFYHFIDARRRTPDHIDDFRTWLAGYGSRYKELCDQIAFIDPFFSNIPEIRTKLSDLFTTCFSRRKG